MKIQIKHSEKGFSMVEMITVIAIIGVILAVAVAQFGTSREQYTRQNIAREFKVNLERCRFDSVRRRPNSNDYANMARVEILSSKSYKVYYDMNMDGTLGASESRTIDFSSISDVAMVLGGVTLPIIIRFDNRGLITTDGSGYGVSPQFTFCTGSCPTGTTLTPVNANIVSISPTGTVAMLDGGDSVYPLTTPSLTNILPSDGVNNLVSAIATPVPSGSVSPTATATVAPTATANPIVTSTPSITGTPAPSVVPTAVPSVVPTAVPSVVPTAVPSATPVPTATPVPLQRCVRNQNVATTPCDCDGGRRVNPANNRCQ